MRPCPLCRQPTDERLLEKARDLAPFLVSELGQAHPGWDVADGLCPACALEAMQRHAAARSLEPVPDCPFSFPCYHPQERSLRSLPQRLPEHWGFDGRGVTVAFLDSGYFPHPDLLDASQDLPQIDWPHLSPYRLRRTLEQLPLRIRQYVNLFEGKERLGLDAPSLWSDLPSNWHGQMSSVIALGNGLLSQGRYRGFAPGAEALLIKIGRRDGRIPEAAILRGLNWLLRNRNWERHGVRVVNISVGGDQAMPWWENAVCLAVEELSRQGVLVVAAAGNGNRDELLPPAPCPSAITVGGVDDGNRPWRPDRREQVTRLALYHHNWGEVHAYGQVHWKPELLALARWAPSPYLPVNAQFREAWALGQAWSALEAGDPARARAILAQWLPLLKLSPRVLEARPLWLRRALCLKMNSLKWVHPFYQHVDGTSVAAPQVAAVAAQMFQANPNLTHQDVKFILTQTALPLGHLPVRRVGAGLLRPARAVAAALRARHGVLAGFPHSGVPLREDELTDSAIPGKVAAIPLQNPTSVPNSTPNPTGSRPLPPGSQPVYFGLYAPDAQAVSLLGSFNRWQPGQLPLTRTKRGWWHTVLLLPPGEHLYRFWIQDAQHPQGCWRPDPENPVRAESGYPEGHSVVRVANSHHPTSNS